MRAMKTVFVFALCNILGFLCGSNISAEPVAAKLYDYVASLDDSPRAKQKDSLYWAYASAATFQKLKESYDPASFESWVDKLKHVHPEMTVDEISSLIKPKKVSTMITYGSGTSVIIELDDAYCIYGMFDQQGRLQGKLSKPIAISYGILLVSPQNE